MTVAHTKTFAIRGGRYHYAVTWAREGKSVVWTPCHPGDLTRFEYLWFLANCHIAKHEWGIANGKHEHAKELATAKKYGEGVGHDETETD